MRKVIILLFAVIVAVPIWAQSEFDYFEVARSVLKAEKKAAVSKAMQLNDVESDAFWPLYEEFTSAEYKIQSKRVQIIKDYGKKYESLTDEKANQLMLDFFKYRQALLALNRKYFKKFKKILPTGKAVRFFQIENKINVLIEAEMALEIPLIEVK